MPFTLNDSKEEIIKKLNNAQGVPQTIQIGTSLLNIKFIEEFLEEQKKYNQKQLTLSRFLTIGTWALVIATLLLVWFA